jgi:alpha-galactosidase
MISRSPLLTNDEVIAVDQNSSNNHELFHRGDFYCWIADVPNSPDKYVALFNTGVTEATVTVNWSDLKITGRQRVRDLWRQKDLGVYADKFETPIASHSAVLVRIFSSP